MPKVPTHALIWSRERGVYELRPADPHLSSVVPGEEGPWFTWLTTHTSFSFQGQAGRLNVFKEARPRGGGYWYAYHSHQGQARKRYLGCTATLTLARLEAVAQALGTELSSQGARAKAVQAERLSAGAGRERSGQRKASSAPLPEIPLSSLAPSLLPASLVEREHVLIRLDAALAHPLTLVSAAAGWGKTTLLSVWARRHKGQIAWLSLSELDNSPTRFWVSLITALRRGAHASPDLGQTAVMLLQSPQPPELSAILTTLLNELESREAQPAPLVLIVDDFHVIEEPAIHEGMSFLLEHLPAYLHLILSSRVDPDLPLARLRVRGQMIEIREADLCFSLQETSHYLSQMLSPMLSEDEVHQLVSRTEGWIAGLHLAVLALRQREDRTAFLQAFSGSQRYLLDYVQEEILARLPIGVRDFLLHAAILSRLDASVCQAVIAAPASAASQATLEWLERANLFLVPLDEERRGYRLHDLFREALLARLQATHPELVPLLHRRAARFYEAQGDFHEAIVHALAASDFPYAARLIERAAPRCWLSGEAQTVQAWIVALPDAVLWRQARLALQATLRLLESLFASAEATYARARALVEPTLARLEDLLRQHGAGAPPGRPAPQKELLVIGRRLLLLRAMIELRAILRRGAQARLAHLAGELEGIQEEEDLSWQVATLIIDCYLIEGFQRAGALLIPRLLEARQQAERAGELLASLRVRSWLAQAYERAAQWLQVERECLAGLALLEQSGVRTAWAGYLQICLAEAYYACNRLNEAAGALQEALRIGQEWQQIELARGELSAADQALSQAEALAQREPWAYLPFPVAAYRVRYWLAVGELEAARHWAEQVVFSPDTLDPNDHWAVLMLVRVQLALGQCPQALELLERFRAPLTRPGDSFTTIEWLALSVMALHQAGRRDQARVIAARLFALTEPEGSLRVYLDEGAPMKQALQSLLSASSDQQEGRGALSRRYLFRLVAAFEQEKEQHTGQTEDHPARQDKLVPLLRGAVTAREDASAHSAPFPLEPLTAQEQRVLRLLAAGRSTQEIAESLVVSVNTVKTHLKNLYSKLQVRSRTQAMAVARERHLL